jgi:cytochrome c-type biogenesis protein CcmH
MKAYAFGLALLLALALLAGPASADGDGAPAESSFAYDLAGELMSPFCPGRTLASCPSPQAGEMIQWIALQEAAGATREEVIAQLVARHGESILGAPPARGLTLWAYLGPVLGFVAFGAVAVVVLRRIVAPGAGPAVAAPVPADAPAVAARGADELARIVDAELAERA